MNYGHVDSLGPDEGVENLTDALSESREWEYRIQNPWILQRTGQNGRKSRE